ncbi:phage tail tube protein [Neisseria leonii]|uniref:Phage tail tube protein n=1 Tax=Neisseria leonii TaxID=2995413 RepID=A0A9X4E2H1_9NEIS|nr:phage tail tube protein [Neisseria sp. 51.81]MDD9326746.1 phage tail tube protein [Neisseria sp. 51.81]
MANLNVASSSYAQLAYIPETVSGVTPDTGKGINLRMTGESLEQTISKETSKEINSSRQTAGMFLTDAQVAGGINFELSSGEYDVLLEACLMDTWSTFGTDGVLDAGSATFSSTGKTVTLTNAAEGLAAGMWFSVQGDDLAPENRGPWLVREIDGGKTTITVAGDVKDQTVTSAKVRAGRLTNGVTERSFSVEKYFSDAGEYFVYRGMQVSKVSLAFESKAAVTGSFDFIGRTSENGKTKFLGDKTDYTESKSGPIIDAVLGMKDVLVDGVDMRETMTAGVQKISVDFDNNMKGADAIGVLGNVDVLAGTISVGGSITMYFQSGAIYNDVIRQRRFNLSWAVFDGNGNGYAFTLPSVELDSPKVNASQKDEPLTVEMNFTALMDPVAKKTIFIDRF